MQGYQLSFFTRQDRKHGGLPLAEWLLHEARRTGIGGGTLIAAAEGFGHHGRLHSAHFFELGDQPVEVTLAARAPEADRLFQRLREEKIEVFYVKTAVEFGTTGGEV